MIFSVVDVLPAIHRRRRRGRNRDGTFRRYSSYSLPNLSKSSRSSSGMTMLFTTSASVFIVLALSRRLYYYHEQRPAFTYQHPTTCVRRTAKVLSVFTKYRGSYQREDWISRGMTFIVG